MQEKEFTKMFYNINECEKILAFFFNFLNLYFSSLPEYPAATGER